MYYKKTFLYYHSKLQQSAHKILPKSQNYIIFNNFACHIDEVPVLQSTSYKRQISCAKARKMERKIHKRQVLSFRNTYFCCPSLRFYISYQYEVISNALTLKGKKKTFVYTVSNVPYQHCCDERRCRRRSVSDKPPAPEFL